MSHKRAPRARGTCAACGRAGLYLTSQTRGWCEACDRRWTRAGKPADGPPPPAVALPDPARQRTPTRRPSALLFRRGQSIATRLATGTLTPPATPAWTEHATCQTDPDAWFPSGTPRGAQKACLACPVLDTCQADALSREEGYGVWGGLTPPTRTRLRAAAGLTEQEADAA